MILRNVDTALLINCTGLVLFDDFYKHHNAVPCNCNSYFDQQTKMNLILQ